MRSCLWIAQGVNGEPCRVTFQHGRRSGPNPRTWRTDGTWERIHTALRSQVRVKQGREAMPSAAIIERPIRENQPKRPSMSSP